MKYLIASDVHGSACYMQKTVDAFYGERADKLILLGDIYNHGPRNPFPTDYAPMKVAEILNNIKDKLIVVKGNCDSQVDTLISEFDFIEDLVLVLSGKTLFLSHGHIYNKDAMPKTEYDAVVYGHFHTGFIEKVGRTTVINTGSVSLPKDGTDNSYLLLDGTTAYLKNFEGKIIKRTEL